MSHLDTHYLDTLNFNADGLIPAIAQDRDTGRILMMAWQPSSLSDDRTDRTGGVF